VYLQTWHGTPLKRIHHDIPNPRPGWLDAPDRDIARWDHLLSANPPSTPLLSGAFRYRGPVHETGYPRNDLLLAPDRDQVRAALRTRLGIPEGKTAVLYAPTWRDDLVFDGTGTPEFAFPIDLVDFAERLGDEHVLLARLHSIVRERLALPPDVPVIDVSDIPDPASLYLAADLMVTDYSSAMFDYAVLDRPVVIFAPDWAAYRELRGVYFDLLADPPGAVATTHAELVEVMRDGRYRGFAAERAAFRKRFCALEDGQAAERVVRRVMLGEQPTDPA
jgi:CDP-glycerol glycerophosphotransferase